MLSISAPRKNHSEAQKFSFQPVYDHSTVRDNTKSFKPNYSNYVLVQYHDRWSCNGHSYHVQNSACRLQVWAVLYVCDVDWHFLTYFLSSQQVTLGVASTSQARRGQEGPGGAPGENNRTQPRSTSLTSCCQEHFNWSSQNLPHNSWQSTVPAFSVSAQCDAGLS